MMFSKADPNTKKDQFLEQAKAARQERAVEKHREQAAITIQKLVRGFLARRRLVHTIRKEVDHVLATDCSIEKNLRPSIEVFKVLKKFFTVFHRENDKERFQQVCKYVVSTMDVENVKVCYVAVALLKEYSIQFINQLKLLLWQCCQYLAELRPESPATTKQMLLYLHTLVTFTATKTWKILRLKQNEALVTVMNQLCNNFLNYLVSKGLYETLQIILVKGLARTTPSLKHASLSAIVTLATRPMSVQQSSENSATLFIIHVLSVPGLLHHTVKISPECLKLFSSLEVFKKCLTQLTTGENARRVFTTLEGSYNLCLLGNLIQLASIEKEVLADNLLDFANVLIRLMESCQKYVITKQSNLTHWHPVLGWFAQKIDHGLHESMPYVKTQLQYLWGKPMLDTLFSPLTQTIRRMSTQSDQQQGGSRSYVVGSYQSSAQTSLSKAPGFLRKALEKAASKSASVKFRKMGSTETIMVAVVCSLYQMALGTFTQLRLDILTGLCSEETLLPDLWQLLASLGPCKAFLDHLAMHTKTSSPEFQMLTLFCDWTTHLVTILDDMELYEQQKPFRLEEIVSIAEFLNHFVFRSIWNNLIDLKTLNKDAFFASIHTLLMLLYQRDCRRKYTSDDFWLITEIKSSTFVSDLEKGKKAAQILLHKVPHIISHKERVLLFRKYIADEKTVLGLTESACASPQSTLITVHRARIVEDGYRQLALLPPQVLKGVIRVKFVNEQGLDEAGIDQDGVFKEFLEETIKRVFNPSLNLFKVTSEERLYPSPISHIQENHLQLFEFVGRMLGKAVYEGIVVDVPFATFFLSQVMGHPQNALYSCIDELPSLDPELYKSLTYIKHYDGDVRDLELTFSFDDECMGQVITHELLPGGRAEPVTNENRISYIHLMAHFRMHVQVHDQTIAFTRGFRSIVNAEWLAMFSTPEVQRLISGDTSEIELEDLRKHTQYYGGFHDNHRVICWLWDILEKDFSPKERSLFLKFVTSCSKPPLLGFAHLEPPFSIRCVEVSDDQDTGDTVGSVLRGFFALHKKDPVFRLPTSSTCFNLLKLPNYQKKSTLREKLRYAINSNTGFELS